MTRFMCWLSGGHRWGPSGWRKGDAEDGSEAVTIHQCDQCGYRYEIPSRMRKYSTEGFIAQLDPKFVDPAILARNRRPKTSGEEERYYR